jgi:hypothetical protein
VINNPYKKRLSQRQTLVYSAEMIGLTKQTPKNLNQFFQLLFRKRQQYKYKNATMHWEEPPSRTIECVIKAL